MTLKALLVDDERLALLQLEKMLKELADIHIVGTSMNPLQAIEMAANLKPDVIFLDIQMPGLSGLQAAEQLQEICPSAEIVFVTAFDEYAIQAFELHALDYVLKPLQRKRLLNTLQRLKQPETNPKNDPHLGDPVWIRCFPSLQIEYKEDQADEFMKWRTSKGQELFAYLLHNRGQLVRKSMLLDLLWPDIDPKKAITLLYTTIYQIRQNLKSCGIDIPIQSYSAEEGYVLDAGRVRLESDEWEENLRMLEHVTVNNLTDHQRVLDMYRGEYLGKHDYLWAEGDRQRMAMRWLLHAQQVADCYAQNRMWNEAVQVYLRIQQEQPLSEDSFFSLMKLYDHMGQRASVEEQYQLLLKMLDQELNLEPKREIILWFENWKQQVSDMGVRAI
ncbi:Two-component response regulator, SAPR family, consists of REC, wHTH and BTAD domains [Paenibacillus sp. 1_12]|uniref:response regulator n=1 Tax=Paenibacillus sp. 1_12 TaxID=1566278 RepID=UPI0008E0A33B|nr:response regulator [Paenibacillus sp. 1_12]SFL76044.1 Two-component response regulator, SAPR family, consists of REC, wHTH and BTAD domains [Paenibacillus sp. 1_12]